MVRQEVLQHLLSFQTRRIKSHPHQTGSGVSRVDEITQTPSLSPHLPVHTPEGILAAPKSRKPVAFDPGLQFALILWESNY